MRMLSSLPCYEGLQEEMRVEVLVEKTFEVGWLMM